MAMRLTIAIAVLAMAIASGGARAAVIVDTGPGPDSSTNAFVLNDQQWLSAQFTTTSDHLVTDVLGWMGLSAGPGTLTAAIYTDGGEIPGEELFSSQFLLLSGPVDWYGATGLSWALAAGTYWVAFEERPGDTLGSAFMPFASPAPLLKEAFWTPTARWTSQSLNIGVQIHAMVVPEPQTYALLLAGLGLLAFAARRQRGGAPGGEK